MAGGANNFGPISTGCYDEAAEDANQVDDILVLPLVFEELHA
jgi:hypothetical protein